MNSAMEILDSIRAHGGELWLVDGERLKYRLPANMEPMIDTLRAHKPEIVEALAQRPAMPAGVRLLSYTPVVPPVKLSQCETVVDSSRFIQSTLQQLGAKLNGECGWHYGWRSLSELLTRLEAVGCEVAIDDPRKALQ